MLSVDNMTSWQLHSNDQSINHFICP